MKICQYCGTENETEAQLCASCGAHEFTFRCDNCNTQFEEGLFCPKCGMRVGTKPWICPRCGSEQYQSVCPRCGYDPNPQNYRQQMYTQPVQEKKMSGGTLALWVLGWIFCFPIPLTVLIYRSKLPTAVKVILITLLWMVIIFYGIVES